MKKGGGMDARAKALQAIASDARRARLGERLPEDRRPPPAFIISIGLGPTPEEEEEDEEEMGGEG